MEPNEYFADLKTNLKGSSKEQFESQIDVIRKQILAADKVGQRSFLDRLAFTHEIIKREQELLAHGITQYLVKDDIVKFLEKIEPKDSVKLIELSRYPRPIPMEELEKIQAVKDLNIFDDFFVVFTDFTDNDYTTEKEKAVVERNRDPVVFGWFKIDKVGLKHDRCYYVADWIDDYCELDFSALVKKMAEAGFKVPSEISEEPHIPELDENSEKEIQRIIKESYENMKKSRLNISDEAYDSLIQTKKSKIKTFMEAFGALWKKST